MSTNKAINIQGEAHKELQSDTGPAYFFIGGGTEATSRSTPLF